MTKGGYQNMLEILVSWLNLYIGLISLYILRLFQYVSFDTLVYLCANSFDPLTYLNLGEKGIKEDERKNK